jgi:hypothetical protein
VSVLANDGIVVHVLNYSARERGIRVQVFQRGAGASQVLDTGSVSVAPTFQWSLSHRVQVPGEYWIEITADEDALVPKVSFERNIGGTSTPFVSYAPADFVIFKNQQRVW